MAKNKTEETVEEEVVETPKAKAAARASVTVEWQGKSRVYSLAVHGEDFEALAEEFATKKNGRIV